MQVDVELPVWEAVSGLMGPVQCERGLANSRGATNRRDHDRPARTSSPVRHAGQCGQFHSPARKARQRTRQLPRHQQISPGPLRDMTGASAYLRRRRPSRGWGGLLAQDLQVRGGELGTRQHAKLGIKPFRQFLVHA